MWEMKAILITLFRNRLGVALVIIQLALTLAIISNAVFVVLERNTLINRETGMPENELFGFNMLLTDASLNITTVIDEDLRLINAMPGVKAATPINTLPLAFSSSIMGFAREPNATHGSQPANKIYVNHNGMEALGVKLIAGRNFREDEMQYFKQRGQYANVAIVTKQYADRLFPDGGALNQTIYRHLHPIKIVGIAERNMGTSVVWSEAGSVIFFPQLELGSSTHYVVRTEPSQRAQITQEIENKLIASNKHRVIEALKGLDEYKRLSYTQDIAMIKILSVVIVMISVIAIMGSIGLTILRINQRRKQIGTRRALGATRLDIIRYYLLENVIVCLLGLFLGGVLSLGLNHFLVQYQHLQVISVNLIVVCASVFFLFSVVAVLWPALRAAQISPALATRSV
ncbi:MAG: ABC transporter permease [Spongiibacteraceae bacterium]|nr:ABC transporter permease [Spongiibacteraceae bacterium]